MKLYRTAPGVVVESDGRFVALSDDWDALINHEELHEYLSRAFLSGRSTAAIDAPILAPIGHQEVWAAGVTYYRSRTARIEESRDAGGGTFYDRVYDAQRPELFFKAAPWRVRGPSEPVRIRHDARWSVPEPEIALCINARGAIVGYTIGNDMSSRDIEGENPLYLSQAKIYDGACALGPALLVTNEPLSPTTSIEMRVNRLGQQVFSGETTYSQLRRAPNELIDFLYRETSFPSGCVLLTGTGIVPEGDFTLLAGDEISITVPPIGVLTNAVAGK
jgi:2-dehydro-3-deoxy-D-arabinonate dehydratase